MHGKIGEKKGIRNCITLLCNKLWGEPQTSRLSGGQRLRRACFWTMFRIWRWYLYYRSRDMAFLFICFIYMVSERLERQGFRALWKIPVSNFDPSGFKVIRIPAKRSFAEFASWYMSRVNTRQAGVYRSPQTCYNKFMTLRHGIERSPVSYAACVISLFRAYCR